ncbi:putative TPR repeat-containing protein [Acanthamoeba polyphaga mimivirus]|uniref:TPR repeat-containing protein n=1 Tax=Acanthamoeba polyphaga mimivirus Kroon TaxID=3069720 RepID=A0A0G2Y456_9VIRU|nr:putative TPR repeat-containing protein [Acanthamoeba polyphaga mimivirus]AKI80583.1 putative TPR repeat-containing protein [Acanthamoeba polyphaga mimivirus Kroon]
MEVINTCLKSAGVEDKTIKKVIETFQKENDEQYNIVHIFNKAAIVFHRNGQHEKSLEMYQKAYENIFNGEFILSDLFYAVNGIASMYQALGDYDIALQKYNSAIKIIKEMCSDDNSDLVYALMGIASISQIKGNYDEALSKYNEALGINEKLHGKNHMETAFVLNRLGINEKLHGKNHMETAFVLNRLGMLYHELDDNKKSINYFNKSLKIYNENYPDKQFNIAFTISKLAQSLLTLGNDNEALEKYQDSINIFGKIFTIPHQAVAFSLYGIGSVYEFRSEYNKALEKYQESLQTYKNVYERSEKYQHYDIACCLYRIGLVYKLIGNNNESRDYLNQANQMFQLTSININNKNYKACKNLLQN